MEIPADIPTLGEADVKIVEGDEGLLGQGGKSTARLENLRGRIRGEINPLWLHSGDMWKGLESISLAKTPFEPLKPHKLCLKMLP
jgi:hypothetical protein